MAKKGHCMPVGFSDTKYVNFVIFISNMAIKSHFHLKLLSFFEISLFWKLFESSFWLIFVFEDFFKAELEITFFFVIFPTENNNLSSLSENRPLLSILMLYTKSYTQFL
jgi:hypothetical protein